MRIHLLWSIGLSLLIGVGCDGASNPDATSGGGDGGSGNGGGGNGSGGSGGTSDDHDPPTAIFALAPPAYWYVDAVPLSAVVAGDDVTHYRYAIDDGAFSDEQPVAAPISIPSVAAGKRTLKILGRDAVGNWQVTPTQASFHMATTGPESTACKLVADGGTCDFILTTSSGFYATPKHFYDANGDGTPDYEKLLDIKPGSKVCLQAGAYDTLNIRGFEGSPEAPVTLVNCGGRVDFAHSHANAALGVLESRYVRIVGVGDAAEPYGITVATSGNQGANGLEITDGSSDVEVAFVEVKSAAYAGIVARTNVSCKWHRASFVQENTFLHHNHVHDTGGEGFYIGGSHWGAPELVESGNAQCGVNAGNGTIVCENDCKFEPELHGVRIYANRVESTAADGIQVGSAWSDRDGTVDYDTEVYDNVVIAGATGDSPYNSGALDINPGTSGRVYRNFVRGTDAYAGLFIAGPGNIDVYNNVIITATDVGLVIQDNDAGAKNGPFRILNNTIVNDGPHGIYMYHTHSQGNLCHNNLLLRAAEAIHLLNASVDWKASSNVTTGSLESHFVNAGEDDYHLLSTSSAVDAGTDVSSLGLTTDFDKLPRKVGPYDVGAFEYRP
ncbi:right-handed parallel beta-helix repeat-containing protein [Polyangium sp. 6x1]|uniref:right-handed parallel beta-helix repeat-containing protein n=1 Tax=Polyangium sp. 6x1 TaxID=3042689 RepID=UPI0024824F53|nr:right-handed parallel beta-helix repeat-containing protein [Polyangium sp. 6x1]MDI1443923.1 right-handed parallel beta-helix repeat-containing protein [Polyangium sp. 6x1]